MHAGDHAHGEPGWETSANTRGDQNVARSNVRALRDVGQAQGVGMAGAVGNGAQSRARHLHWHRVVGIGHQQGNGAVARHLHHLAEHPARIDQCLANLHAIVAAGIQHQPLPERIQVNVNDADHAHAERVAARAAEQLPQPDVFLGHGVKAMDAGDGYGKIAPATLVLVEQLAAKSQRLGRRTKQLRWRSRQPAEGFGEHGKLLPRQNAVAAAMVGQHHADGHGHVDEQRQRRQGAVAGAGRIFLSSVGHAISPAVRDAGDQAPARGAGTP